MASFSRFELILVRFPFSERAAYKRRPGLVLSNAAFQASHGHCLMAMITTASVTKWPSDILITDLAGTGLRTTSYVRLKLFTLSEELMIGRLGALSQPDRPAVDRSLADLLRA